MKWSQLEVLSMVYPRVGSILKIVTKEYYVCGYSKGHPLVQLVKGVPPILRMVLAAPPKLPEPEVKKKKHTRK